MSWWLFALFVFQLGLWIDIRVQSSRIEIMGQRFDLRERRLDRERGPNPR